MNSPIKARLQRRIVSAKFSIRFAGVQFTFHCKKVDSYKRGIRKARALRIREKVLTAQPSQYCKLNPKQTHWTFYGPTLIGPVPAGDVHWALADTRNLIETWHRGKVTRWKIVQTIAECYMCGTACEVKQNYWYPYTGVGVQPAIISAGEWLFWTPVCSRCRARFAQVWAKVCAGELPEDCHWDFLSCAKVDTIASKDRSSNLRWIRKFVAEGNFTAMQFKTLCQQYGNVCSRCRKKRVLVADHVIPLAKGGRNDISNIQPLCARCNGIKGTNPTDYRKMGRTQFPMIAED